MDLEIPKEGVRKENGKTLTVLQNWEHKDKKRSQNRCLSISCLDNVLEYGLSNIIEVELVKLFYMYNISVNKDIPRRDIRAIELNMHSTIELLPASKASPQVFEIGPQPSHIFLCVLPS